MFGWLKNIVGRAEAQLPAPRVSDTALARRFTALRARYDAAMTTHDNRRHWAHADALSADAAATADVRRTLRNRSRYEVANNSYARGIVLTLANDTVGTGPRLQMLSGLDAVNREVEREFELWALEVSLAEKLRTMRMARCQDGESFAILANNPGLDGPVKLDLKLIEADQVTSPLGFATDPQEVDGIRLDRFRQPDLLPRARGTTPAGTSGRSRTSS